MASDKVKVAILMADYGHDPTETAVPFSEFKKAGWDITIFTENGSSPKCDKRMLEGWTQKLLGATQDAVSLYDDMTSTPEWQHASSWSSPTFDLSPFTLVFLPGGHEKGVRQVIDSRVVQTALGAFFPQTRKPSRKAVAAICHGVMALAEGKTAEGRSVLCDATTTALPGAMEGAAYHGTRLFLGDYYKTYGAGSESVEEFVRKKLDDDKVQYRNSLGLSPFVVKDEKYNYISGRFPPDAKLLADEVVALVGEISQAVNQRSVELMHGI
ncbi:class I glutamine amidotransferase-like protein [Viridothelium virens]|uniref:Class I glutamine amidotransferase-like protein n=1 Tax=Viridothelium virens TaxID=1048519 RepID=A0A6A6HN09_VIRVR|nr:class I glutamine amidotransferase-like protein [Viridothelium virens]